jgi:hypothetical protein
MTVDRKYTLLKMPQNYQDLSEKTTGARLTRDLKTIVDAINNNRTVALMDIPSNFAVTGASGYAALTWDDVPDAKREDLDGIRIWRALASDDAHESYDENSAKTILVGCIRTTKYVDVEVAAGDYIYWVQWINLDGKVSGAAGGVTGTVT